MEKLSSMVSSKKKRGSEVSSGVLTAGTDIVKDDFNGKLFELEKQQKLYIPGLHKRYFIGVSTNQISELHSNTLKPNKLTAQECFELSNLIKVKFKRGEMITLYFRNDIIKQYSIVNCSECVALIKQHMTDRGMSLISHTSRNRALNIATAQNLLDVVNSLEAKFVSEPSHHLVLEVMNLLREAVECFGEANDTRYVAAIHQIQEFLQRTDVLHILNEFIRSGGSIPNERGHSIEQDEGNDDEGFSISDGSVGASPLPCKPAHRTNESPSPDTHAIPLTPGELEDEDEDDMLLNNFRRQSRRNSVLRREFARMDCILGTCGDVEEEESVVSSRGATPSRSPGITAYLVAQETPPVSTATQNQQDIYEDDSIERSLIEMLDALYSELDGIVKGYEHRKMETDEGSTEGVRPARAISEFNDPCVNNSDIEAAINGPA